MLQAEHFSLDLSLKNRLMLTAYRYRYSLAYSSYSMS